MAKKYEPRLNLSASKLDRAYECAASMVLPVIRSTGEGAEQGIEIHGFLERLGTLVKQGMDFEAARRDALAGVPPEHADYAAAIDIDRLPLGAHFRYELSVAYDYETGKVRLVGEGRQKGPPARGPTEIIGVADVAADDEAADEVFVGDYKTGIATAGGAARSKQLRWLAMAIAKLTGRLRARTALVYPRPDGRVIPQYATLDAFELDAIEAEFQEVVARGRREQGKLAKREALSYSTGGWCSWCDSFVFCAAQTALIRTMAAAPKSIEARVEEALQRGDPATAVLRYEEMQASMKQVGKAIWRFAAKHAIDLPDGRRLGSYDRTTKSLDTPAALATLVKTVPQNLLEAAVQPPKLTFSALKDKVAIPIAKAQKAAGVKTTQAAVYEGLVATLNVAGAVKQETKPCVGFHRPGEPDEDDDE